MKEVFVGEVARYLLTMGGRMRADPKFERGSMAVAPTSKSAAGIICTLLAADHE